MLIKYRNRLSSVVGCPVPGYSQDQIFKQNDSNSVTDSIILLFYDSIPGGEMKEAKRKINKYLYCKD